VTVTVTVTVKYLVALTNSYIFVNICVKHIRAKCIYVKKGGESNTKGGFTGAYTLQISSASSRFPRAAVKHNYVISNFDVNVQNNTQKRH
jgi:hypothetical protein